MINLFTNELKTWKRTKGVYWPCLLQASENIQAQSLTEKDITGTGGGIPVDAKAILFYRPGTVRIYFQWWGQYLCSIKIYSDSTLICTLLADNEGEYPEETWNTYTFDIDVKFLQTIKLVADPVDTGYVVKVKNFKVGWDVVKIKQNLSI